MEFLIVASSESDGGLVKLMLMIDGFWKVAVTSSTARMMFESAPLP
jgi:hypothetical protein